VSITDVINRINATIGEAEKEALPAGVIGVKRLLAQSFDKEYRPAEDKKGRTPFIECINRDLRKVLIASYKSFKELCYQAWQAVSKGLEANWPRGAFVPSRRWQVLTPVPLTS